MQREAYQFCKAGLKNYTRRLVFTSRTCVRASENFNLLARLEEVVFIKQCEESFGRKYRKSIVPSNVVCMMMSSRRAYIESVTIKSDFSRKQIFVLQKQGHNSKYQIKDECNWVNNQSKITTTCPIGRAGSMNNYKACKVSVTLDFEEGSNSNKGRSFFCV